MGFFLYEPASTSFSFQMSGDVSCQYFGYYGRSFANSQTVSASGECGWSPEGASPQCEGHVGPPMLMNGTAYVWMVETSAAGWANPNCWFGETQSQQISVNIEGCGGSTCCSAGAYAACVHSGGLFDGCVCGFSPVVISLDGPELRLTDAAGGVSFDMRPDGVLEQTSWTRAGSEDAFLVLDRNRNGRIDDSKELFGSTTDQPPTTERNGFNALSAFDDNGDRRIDAGDPIYALLGFWTDRNHNGISESGELQSMRAAGVISISLDYRESRRRDRFGNKFRYAASVKIRRGGAVATHLAWDVFFVGPQ